MSDDERALEEAIREELLVPHGSEEQDSLFDVEPAWQKHWEGMPEYSHEDLQPDSTLLVHFPTLRDRADFAKLVGQRLHSKTKFIWFPKAEIRKASDKVYTGDKSKFIPRYPVYIISKGRWESRLTSKALEWIGVPYHIVVEPQELEQYAAVIAREKILVTPFSNLGQGGIPVRNFVWEHALSTGAKRHWILDDNISGFCRFQDNLKVEVDNGSTFCAVEDWCDRYENVVMAAFNYDYFAPRKQGAKISPLTINTRCYSGILLRNDLPHRWRGRYNEDTDLSLRLLKDGYCTALFNAFLMYKKPTLTMKGGNTDELYAGVEASQAEWESHAAECDVCRKCLDGYGQRGPCDAGKVILEKDGRWRMAEHLRLQHPDCTTVERKWGRWQHQVDYRAFARNELVLSATPPPPRDYGMTLGEMPPELGGGHDARGTLMGGGRPKVEKQQPNPAQEARQVSALAFISSLPGPAPEARPEEKPEAPAQAGEQLLASPQPAPAAPEAPPAASLAAETPPPPEVLAAGLKLNLENRGHRVMTDGAKLFVSEASLLSDEDRLIIKRYRPELIAIADQLSTHGGDGAGVSRPGVHTSEPPAERTSLPPEVDHEEAKAEAQEAGDINTHESRSPDGDGQRGANALDDGPDDYTYPQAGGPDAPKGSAGVVIALQGDERLHGETSEEPAAGSKPADSLFDEPRTGQTLAQFLGSEPPRVVPNWRPDEVPDLSEAKELVFNLATDGLSWRDGARPVGITVSTLDGKLTRFLPFAFPEGGNHPEEQVRAWAASREGLAGKKLHNANTKFDVHHSREWGVDLEALGCTFTDIQHTAALLDDHRKVFNVDKLVADYLPDLASVRRVDETQHSHYHASDVAERERFTAEAVWRLRDVMYPELERQGLVEIQGVEDGVIPAVVEMERVGSPIDVTLLEEFHREVHAEHQRLMREVSAECGFAFEHTAAGWRRLLEHLGLPTPDSYAEAMLNQIHHPLVQRGQLASQHASYASKVLDPYMKNVRDGVLYYDINQLRGDEGGTVSGRFSIEYVQQVPNADNHRAAFGDRWNPRRLYIPGSGQYLEADAAQIEFRLFAHYANNPKIIDWYKKDPRMSFHKMTWEMIKAYKPDMLYTEVKSFNFAGQYGAKSIKLAIMMGHITEQEGDEIRRAKRWDDPRLKPIKEIEAAYRKMLPEREPLLDRASHLMKPKCDEYCRQGDALHRLDKHRGFVRTLRGRRSRSPNGYKTYIGLNRILQGTGADIMKVKAAQLHRERKHTGFIMRITNHDAALGDATLPETESRVSEILNEQCYPELRVPILWECGTGPNWAEAKG